jgi:hypothetical protein
MMNCIDDAPEVVVSGFSLSPLASVATDQETSEWLRGLWGCAPDFADRLVDLAPEPIGSPR